MTQIVCVSHELWGEAPQRIARLTEGLKGVEVLFFEPYQPFFSRLRRPKEGMKLSAHVTVYTLPCAVSRGEDAYLHIEKQSRKNATYIRRCMQEEGFDHPILWLRCPDQVMLAFEITERRGLVYDCDREWKGMMDEWEITLTHESDLIFAASPALEERLEETGDNVIFMPNGMDGELFARAREHYDSVPADLQHIPHPILGCLDEIGDYAQLKPVLHTAKQHPEWSFVFLGAYSTCNESYSKLKRLKNVYFLEEKSQRSLPRYLAGVDALFTLLPNQQKDSLVLPAKLGGCLASGKPVISMTGGRGDKNFPEWVYLAHFGLEFDKSCEFALKESYPEEMSARRIAVSHSYEWSVLSGRVAQLFETHGFS